MRARRPAWIAALAVALASVTAATLLRARPTETTPARPAADGDTRIAVIGDFGADNPGEARLAALVDRLDPTHVVTVGDNVYSTAPTVVGTDKFDLTVGKYFCRFLSGALAGPGCPSGGLSPTNRFFPALGNHDYTDAGVDVYQSYFSLPGAGVTNLNPTADERVYDAVLGPVHLFFLDSEAALRDPAELVRQREWLRQGLTSSTAPWQVVLLHHSPYSSGMEHGSERRMRWPFSLWGADLVLSGHDHDYERISRDGITYVVSGLGGASRYPFAATPVVGSVVRYNDSEAASVLTASAASLRLDTYDVNDRLLDTYDVPAAPALQRIAFQDGVEPTAAYAGTRDATISEDAPDTPLGTQASLRGDGDDGPTAAMDLYSLVSWDISAIPRGSTVLSASVVFNVTNTAVNQPYRMFPLQRTWNENEVTWNRADVANPWLAPGATDPTERGSGLIGQVRAAALGPLTVALDDPAVALVQGWLDRPAMNAGLIVVGPDNDDGWSADSRETTTPGNRPRLEVIYRLPQQPVVATTALPNATVGKSYSRVLTAAGGVAPYRWALASGALPPGIKLAAKTGTVWGTPTGIGEFPFTVTATDTIGGVSTPQALRIVVVRPRPGDFGKVSPLTDATAVGAAPTLVWAPSSFAVEYQYCVDAIDNNKCDRKWVSTTATSAVITTPPKGNAFVWQVRAVNETGARLADAGAWWRFSRT